jgi:antitoxin ParD1/3/4
MSFPLPPEFERAVLDRVRSGQFASPEDVLSAMMEALEDAEALRAEIQVGLEQADRGEIVDGDEAFEWLRARSARIPAELRAFVDEEVRLGRYESPDKVIEIALAVLHDSQLIEDAAREELFRELDLGIESGDNEELIPGDEVVARFAARLTSPEIEEFVERKIRGGEYRSFSEAAAAGLRILMQEERDSDREDLRRELQIGRDSLAGGEGIPADQARQMIMNWRDKGNSV